MTPLQNPQFRVAGLLRTRVNILAHRAGQRYALERRDTLIRLLEEQARAGLASKELGEYLAAFEREAAP